MSKKNGKVLNFTRGYKQITEAEMNNLTMQKDAVVITAVCRKLGRTDWDDIIKDESFWKRGKWMEHPDGEEVFSWDGVELLLFGPIVFNHINQKWVRKTEWLRDPNDYVYHTKEDEEG
jgi:hypothetical protein